MDLILWRHADAEAGALDLDRRLTAKGVKQAERVGAWLDKHLPAGCRILVSPAERAKQTAAPLKRKCQIVPELAPGAGVEAILDAAGWPDAATPALVVGHQPCLGEVAAFLVSGKASPWSIRKGGVWWLASRERGGDSSVIVKVVIGPDFV